MFHRLRESVCPVPPEKLWGVLWGHGDDTWLLLAVKSPHSCSEDCVSVDGVKSQSFSVGVGLRQWCVLSPLLFLVYIKVLHTTARGTNPTYEAISPGHKTHFANNEKIIQYIYEKCVDLVECSISRKKTHYARYLALELLCNSLCGLSQKIWSALVYMNLLDGHRRVDKGATVGNCRMNRLLFADELVLHAWIFATGSSAHILSVFCCVRPRRNEN